ncbi:MAG: ABC transporter ATP-binding protein [Candidatus Thorarchaeota archaeon]
MTEEDLVVVQNLSFTYERGPHALEHLNLSIKRGEVVAVLGANGAGKTTLCFHLNGIIPTVYAGAEKGQITVAGMDPWETPIIELAEHVSMVLQDPETQFVTNDVDSELAFGPANLGVPKEEILRRMEFAKDLCGLQGMGDRSPKELSGGQKQRVAFGAAVTMQPDLLVLDEPTSQLDPIGTKEILETLHRLTQEGTLTIFVATHKTKEIAPLASRVLVLHKGKQFAYGPPREVFSRAEELSEIGVNAPDVTLLFKMLEKEIPGFKENYESFGGIPITLQEAYDYLKKMLDEGFLELVWKEPEDVPPPDTDTVIDVQDLVFTYPGRVPVTALKGVSLKIRRGEIVAIIGQNGSGKTTLVKHFVGLLRPTDGTVYIDGKDIREETTGSLAKSVSLILQNPDYQLFSISAEKEIEFGLRNLKLPEDEIKRRVDFALKEVGLEEYRDIFPFRLSFGDRRKLAAAAGIAMDPEILILDEPTTAQDYEGRHQLCKIAMKMQKQGKTIVMISHDMDLIATYAPRVIVMAGGTILADGPTREVFAMADVLKEADIRPPQIAELSMLLRDYGVEKLLLTVPEMAALFRRGGA